MPLDCLGILNLAQRMLKEGKTVRWRKHRHYPPRGTPLGVVVELIGC